MGRRKASAFDRAQRTDDYVNPYTGIGDYNRDKMLGGRLGGSLDFVVRQFTQREAEDRWRGSDLGGRIIEAIPDEMTREGWELAIQPNDDETSPQDKPEDEAEGYKDAFGQPPGKGPPSPMAAALMPAAPKNPKPIEQQDGEPERICEAIEAKMEGLGAVEAITRALQYERAYGGAVILMGINDGKGDLTQPLDEEKIKDISWLNVFGGGKGGEVIAYRYYNDPRSSKFGTPEIYQIRNLVTVGGPTVPGGPAMPVKRVESTFYVHESRVLTFPGVAVSYRARYESRGWGDSIFTRVDEVLSQYSQTWGGVANLMSQFHMDVLKMSGFAVGMAGGDKASKGSPLSNRAHQINMTKGIARMLVIDSEEEFERATASLAGVDVVLQQFAFRLAAAADMPVELLLGQMKGGGLNNGEGTIQFFYDRIAAKQKRFLLPILRRLYRLVMLSKEGPCEGEEPEMWNIKFNPLTQMTELEQATLRKTISDADVAYINAGVVSAEEVAASRFGGSEWSMETTIDFESRQEMADQDAKDQEAKQKLMSESAKAGVDPGQLALTHPENPLNLPKPKSAEPDAPPKAPSKK